MDSISALLLKLQRASIRLWLDAEQLRYRAPAGALSPALADEISSQRSDIIARLRQLRDARTQAPPTLSARRATGPIPMSNMQRHWHGMFRTAGINANVTSVHRLIGALDVAVLGHCLREIIRRHESLRTRFEERDGQLLQIIDPDHLGIFTYVEVPGADLLERRKAALSLAQEATKQRFDCTLTPPIKISLLMIAAEEHLLLIAAHHVLVDRISLQLFMQELTILYEAYLSKLPSPLPELPIQYADFSIWEQRWLTGNTLRSRREYWQHLLSGASFHLELPCLDPDSSTAADRLPSRWGMKLEVELTSRLERIAHSNAATLRMVLTATFVAFLARWTRRLDLALSVLDANRPLPELERLIANFAQAEILRAHLTSTMRFDALLSQVRDSYLVARDYALPLSMIDTSAVPNVPNVRMNLAAPHFGRERPAVALRQRFPGLENAFAANSQSATSHDLVFLADEHDDPLSIVFQLGSNMRTSARTALDMFHTMLTEISLNPTLPLDHLSMRASSLASASLREC